MTEECFLRLAKSELDRAYRLVCFLRGDAQEVEHATQRGADPRVAIDRLASG